MNSNKFDLKQRAGYVSDALTVGFMALIVGLANGLAIPFLLFPELAALTSDVLHRPTGKWAKEPWKLIATPTLTAVFGTILSAKLGYGVWPILMSMFLGLLVIRLLKSSVSPAISAGILPIVLGVRSWGYPLCILATLSCLTLILLIWNRTGFGKALGAIGAPGGSVIERLESPPQGRFWLSSLTAFVVCVGSVAEHTGFHFILFPPLVVLAYEMLGHPDTCPWAKQPIAFPVISTLAASAGIIAVKFIGVNAIGAAFILIFTLGLLRVGRLRLPPALAVGLIPFVIPNPQATYAISVGLGTSALTIWFFAHAWSSYTKDERSKLLQNPSP